MKNIFQITLLVACLSGSALMAQHDPQLGKLNKDFASVHRIKSVKWSSVFETGKDSCVKYDSGAVDFQYYDISGRITSSAYLNHLHTGMYRSNTRFTYNPDGTEQTFVFRDVTGSDSSYLYDSFRFYELEIFSDRKVIREMGMDSVLRETNITSKDTTYHSHKYSVRKFAVPESADYIVGNFDSMSVCKSEDSMAITTDYFNHKGKKIFSAVDHFNKDHLCYQTTLCNYGDPSARGFHTRYDATQIMSDWVPISKKGNFTYVITRTFDSNGLIIEKRMESVKKSFPPVIVTYSYEYY